MPLYRNIQTGVVYEFHSSHWDNLSNQHHYELVEEEKPKPVVKKKAVKKTKKKSG